MSETRYPGLDAFKLAAAFLVVAIHTSPLTTYTLTGDVFLTRVLGRVAVPFFFMVTGHFVLGPILQGRRSLWPTCRKLLLLYGLAVLLYLPLGLYAGHYDGLTPAHALRLLLFDSTFYHLWYFPACVMGLGLLAGAGRFLSQKGLFLLAGILYLAGLSGDSYYGLAALLPGVEQAWDWAFQLFSYSRNGLFFPPLFLLLGAWLGQRPTAPKPKAWALGFFLSLAAMTAEAFLLRHWDAPRHDSMYLLLPVVMVFLYRLLMVWTPSPHPACRTLSTVIYVVHPAMIVVVRGAAEVLGLTALLVENSLAHYGAVCLLSLALAWAVVKITEKQKRA